jgi:membrane protein DedA with SNARE-associated domain
VSLEQFADDALAWIRAAPAALSLSALGAAAALEYVFPPFPGDTIVLAGGLLAGQRALPLWATFTAIWLGSVAGTLGSWSIGRFAVHSPRVYALVVRFLSEERLKKVVDGYARHGKWIVLANRFLPGIRSTFIFASGLAGVPVRIVLLYGGLSALLWNGLLVFVGYLVGQNLERMMALLKAYATVAYVIVGCALAFFAGRALWRRLRSR